MKKAIIILIILNLSACLSSNDGSSPSSSIDEIAPEEALTLPRIIINHDLYAHYQYPTEEGGGVASSFNLSEGLIEAYIRDQALDIFSGSSPAAFPINTEYGANTIPYGQKGAEYENWLCSIHSV